mmetsp:Transcript_3254/g.9231  ORF Transcript_3254/g.9231 Transcript_3254/m.9231 type:complete len:777 (-) Transcript_3254:16-2346(-)
MMSGSSMSASVVASAAALVRQYFSDGFYPMGGNGISPSYDASAALIRAILITASQVVNGVAAVDGSIRDSSTDFLPNRRVGFGRVELLSVLRITKDVALSSGECSCIGKTLVNDLARFGPDYGSSCNSWNSMDERAQRCDTIFPLLAAKGNLGPWCCQSWCFVDSTCTSAVAFPVAARPNSDAEGFENFSNIFVSYDICKDNAAKLDSCIWRTGGGVIDVRTIARDHVLNQGSRGGTTYDPAREGETVVPSGGSIANNETFIYVVGAAPPQGAGPQSDATKFVVTLTWTDPPGLPGYKGGLVNDLDLMVKVIPFSVNVTYDMTLEYLSTLPRQEALAITYFGNMEPGGDKINNIEQVRLFINTASAIEISVLAKRIVAGSGLSASNQSTPCQSFALVWNGPLLGGLTNILPFKTQPAVLQGGICGRNPAPPPGSAKVSEILVASLVVTICCGSILIASFVYWRRSRSIEKVQHRFETDTVELTKEHRVEIPPPPSDRIGRLQDGGKGWAMLDAGASKRDGMYSGSILVATSSDQSEADVSSSAIIADYDAKQRIVQFTAPVELGRDQQFTITSSAAPNRPARGYTSGSLGMVPYESMPPERHRDPNDSIYLRLFEANQGVQDRTRQRLERAGTRTSGYMTSQERFDQGSIKPVQLSQFELSKSQQTVFVQSVRNRKYQSVTAELSIVTAEGHVDPFALQNRQPRNIFQHDLPQNTRTLHLLSNLEHAAAVAALSATESGDAPVHSASGRRSSASELQSHDLDFSEQMDADDDEIEI